MCAAKIHPCCLFSAAELLSAMTKAVRSRIGYGFTTNEFGTAGCTITLGCLYDWHRSIFSLVSSRPLPSGSSWRQHIHQIMSNENASFPSNNQDTFPCMYSYAPNPCRTPAMIINAIRNCVQFVRQTNIMSSKYMISFSSLDVPESA